jgi:hypothetical protein
MRSLRWSAIHIVTGQYQAVGLDSSVDIATGKTVGVRFSARGRYFLFSTVCLGPIQPLIQWVTGGGGSG